MKKSELKPCHILIEPDHGAYGFAAWLFNQPDQHCLMVSENTGYAWEGLYNGVNCNPISDEKVYQVYEINNLTPLETENILARAKKDQGKPYGNLELLEIAIQLKTGINLGFLGGDDDPLVCSGYLTQWTRPDRDLTPGMVKHLVKPVDIANSASLKLLGLLNA